MLLEQSMFEYYFFNGGKSTPKESIEDPKVLFYKILGRGESKKGTVYLVTAQKLRKEEVWMKNGECMVELKFEKRLEEENEMEFWYQIEGELEDQEVVEVFEIKE